MSIVQNKEHERDEVIQKTHDALTLISEDVDAERPEGYEEN
ncbi:MAG: hypothetical protein QF815_00685 [Candidatus Peribacteraceae bacterium]|jgi:hypothetical protein|nr:hypothetical protein [Candidatus Peribacteraceae bacterium]MDP7477231.1 hypothetical protein [Candidatus Peribacteraceae bacterium]